MLVIGLWVLVTCIVIAGGTTFGGITDLSSAAGYYAEAYGAETIPVVYSALFTTAIDMVDLAGLFFYGLFTFLCFFAGYVSLVRRIKAKILWKGSLLCALITAAGRVWRSRSVTLRGAAAVLGFMFLQWLAILFRDLPFWCWRWRRMRQPYGRLCAARLQRTGSEKGSKRSLAGIWSNRIDLNGLRGRGAGHRGEDSIISEARLNKAVDEAMRNERLKTDLITNVSHDIKTPLTSIINYVDILKRSNIADEKIRGYLDILESKPSGSRH